MNRMDGLTQLNLPKEVWNLNSMCILTWKLEKHTARSNGMRNSLRPTDLSARMSSITTSLFWLGLRLVPILLTLMQIAITYAIADEGTARKIFTEGDGTFQPKSFKLSRWTWEHPESWDDLLGGLRPKNEIRGCRDTITCSDISNMDQSQIKHCSQWIWAHCLPWEVCWFHAALLARYFFHCPVSISPSGIPHSLFPLLSFLERVWTPANEQNRS